jgi:hypothetical protein
MVTRQIWNPEVWDLRLPIFAQPFLDLIAQNGRMLLTDDTHQVKAMRYHFVDRFGDLLVFVAEDGTSMLINWKTMIYVGVHPWLMVSDKTIDLETFRAD